MITKPSNWENVQASVERQVLPAGGYICEIKNAQVMTYGEGEKQFSRLDISIEIADGEYKGFYSNDYRSQQQEDKKWKGVLRQYLPKDSGDERDEWTKSNFKSLVLAIEESNPDYHWDWDETKLKGKIVGCLFRNEEWQYNGRSGWKAQPFKFIDVQQIKDNKFTVPKEKPLQNKTSNNGFTPVDVSNSDDLPF